MSCGLRNSAMNGPRTPPRGPAASSAAALFCSADIASESSGGMRSIMIGPSPKKRRGAGDEKSGGGDRCMFGTPAEIQQQADEGRPGDLAGSEGRRHGGEDLVAAAPASFLQPRHGDHHKGGADAERRDHDSGDA